MILSTQEGQTSALMQHWEIFLFSRAIFCRECICSLRSSSETCTVAELSQSELSSGHAQFSCTLLSKVSEFHLLYLNKYWQVTGKEMDEMWRQFSDLSHRSGLQFLSVAMNYSVPPPACEHRVVLNSAVAHSMERARTKERWNKIRLGSILFPARIQVG